MTNTWSEIVARTDLIGGTFVIAYDAGLLSRGVISIFSLSEGIIITWLSDTQVFMNGGWVRNTSLDHPIPFYEEEAVISRGLSPGSIRFPIRKLGRGTIVFRGYHQPSIESLL